MASLSHDRIDYNGIAFSTEFPAESPDGVANSYCHDFGMKNAGLWNLKMERFTA